MLLLKQDNTKREGVERILKLDACNNNNKKYKMEAIWESAVYANKSKSGHLSGFYYLVV